MAKIFPFRQTLVDEKLSNGEQVVITRVTIVSSADHVDLPVTKDAALLQGDRTTADPTFYLTNSSTRFNIDGATVGSEQVITSRHAFMNYDPGDNNEPNRPK